jgi:PAS domain-containing protein
MNSLDLVHLRAFDSTTGILEYESENFDEQLFQYAEYRTFGFLNEDQWKLTCVPSTAGRDRLTSFAYNIMLANILIITFMLSIVCFVSSNRYRQIRQTVKQKTAQLEWTQQSLQAVLSSMKDMLLSFDGTLTIVQANKAALKSLGYERSDIIGMPLSKILISEDLDLARLDIVVESPLTELSIVSSQRVRPSIYFWKRNGRDRQKAHKSSQSLNLTVQSWVKSMELKEFEVRRRNGTHFDAEINFSQIELKENSVYIAVFRDVVTSRLL